MRIELVGLPGVGKSTLLESIGCNAATPVSRVEASSLWRKVHYGCSGLFTRPVLLWKGFWDCVSNPSLAVVRRYLVLLERIGRLRSNTELVIDEGPAQAVWALYFQRPISDSNRRLFTSLVSAVLVSDRCVFVSANRTDHVKLTSSRARKHPAITTSSNQTERSRQWMAELVRLLRRNASVECLYRKNEFQVESDASACEP